ncbi:Bifunctional DNA Primase/polymerase [Myxococcus stipitatus DSM 14675]|uniref:Bifunctional DNA Primase/polymerase n=1 Tax=Myxococcus stipitatus (strain DSM 14675 / JCM 12634 / Mx s8) TaxID=1278073 RepID=L7U565_MYXSD|nr:bifunctional DNA primase/polymerase [Myxococcus stipitatus]AGC43278.1 Bifunctional DNA Primase/polymerase [Myxococcus stipitatus DSM 14675]
MKAAILLARRGWAVVPLHSARADGSCSCSKGATCNSAGKHPRLLEWGAEATNDETAITEWWREWPDANLGVATGETSGFFVLDVDPDKGGDVSLAALVAEHGPLPVTTQATTGSGGSHYLFALPEGRVVTNSAGRVGLGLDIRGDGGQIVVAPSRSAKGMYRWVAGRAPWEVEPADAPVWLLGRLSHVQNTEHGRVLATDRGYFPAASPEVLNAAREALELHGPAIDGQGGGLHTFQAGALLRHDFALTEAEAWPLMVEWNKTCVPPWELEGGDSLRVMLSRGDKYGSLPYGNRRSLDALETVRKVVSDWQSAGGGDEPMLAMLEQVRPIIAGVADPARRELITRELTAGTGLAASKLGLPKYKAESQPTKQGEIRVSTDVHRVADESLAAIAPRVFARNGVLCEVVRAERTFINDLEPAGIVDLMSRSAKYVRVDENKGLVTQAAPKDVATILHARRRHEGVRVLEAITTAPVFLADGSILQERGYNAQARLYLEPEITVDVTEWPSRGDAQAAVAQLRDLVCDFHFLTPADFSSWLAALLTPLCKSAIGNAPAPLVCISAAVPGSGKTFLAHIIGRIVTGASADIRPYNPRDPAEWGKRLTSFVKSAAPVNLFDDVNGAIGDESLDRLITATSWSDRQLGGNDAPPLPVVGTWLASGNNIEPQGATVRRVLMVRLNVLEERPQDRTGFKHGPNPDLHALAHRSAYLSAALTILRAYHCASRPDQRLPSWGSFGPWSDLVRGALVWAGCADPYETQRRATLELHDTDHDTHDWWMGVIQSSDGTPGSICLTANQRDAQGHLGAREQLAPIHLKRFISRFVDKPRAGRAIRRRRDTGRGITTYAVEALT